jgi:hypothetical protein
MPEWHGGDPIHVECLGYDEDQRYALRIAKFSVYIKWPRNDRVRQLASEALRATAVREGCREVAAACAAVWAIRMIEAVNAALVEIEEPAQSGVKPRPKPSHACL